MPSDTGEWRYAQNLKHRWSNISNTIYGRWRNKWNAGNIRKRRRYFRDYYLCCRSNFAVQRDYGKSGDWSRVARHDESLGFQYKYRNSNPQHQQNFIRQPGNLK